MICSVLYFQQPSRHDRAFTNIFTTDKKSRFGKNIKAQGQEISSKLNITVIEKRAPYEADINSVMSKSSLQIICIATSQSVGVALNVRFTTNEMCAKNNTIYICDENKR